MVRGFLVFFIFSALFLTGCIISGGDDDKTKDRRPRQTPEEDLPAPPQQDIPLPVGLELGEDPNIELNFEVLPGGLVLKIDAGGKKMVIFSTLDGEFTIESESLISIQDLNSSLKMSFELGPESLVYLKSGQQAQKGVKLAETAEPVHFYVEENGERLKQCVNFINQAPENVVISDSGGGCSEK